MSRLDDIEKKVNDTDPWASSDIEWLCERLRECELELYVLQHSASVPDMHRDSIRKLIKSIRE